MRQVKEQMQINTGFKLDVFYNGEIIDLSDDRRTVHQFGLRDKMVMQAKLVHSNVPNSPDSSEESSGGSPNHFTGGSDGPNTDAEESLPSVVILIKTHSILLHDVNFTDTNSNNLIVFI